MLFRSPLCAAIFGLSICNVAEAATLQYSGHTKSLRVSSCNIHYTPEFGVDTAGALPGTDDDYADSTINEAIIFTESFRYDADILAASTLAQRPG